MTVPSFLADDFYFTFDQSDATLGENTIRLTYGSTAVVDITLTKNWKEPPSASEVLVAYFAVDGIGFRPYTHALTEMYYSHVYSIPYIGKTVLTNKSYVSMTFGQDYSNICLWVEQHQYAWTGGAGDWVDMYSYSGIFPPGTAGRKCTEVRWCIPSGLQGIGKCVGLLWDYGGGTTPAVITNAEVDRSMPE